jgi:hypothetical protein
MQQKLFLSVIAAIGFLPRGAPDDEVPDFEKPFRKN